MPNICNAQRVLTQRQAMPKTFPLQTFPFPFPLADLAKAREHARYVRNRSCEKQATPSTRLVALYVIGIDGTLARDSHAAVTTASPEEQTSCDSRGESGEKSGVNPPFVPLPKRRSQCLPPERNQVSCPDSQDRRTRILRVG